MRVEKGPKDLREIPRYFGQAAAAADYGAYRIEILAEINNAPKLAARSHHGRRRLFPGQRRRCHRRRLYAGAPLPRAGRRGPRAAEAPACGSASTASTRGDPDRGGGGRGDGAQRQPVQPRGRAGRCGHRRDRRGDPRPRRGASRRWTEHRSARSAGACATCWIPIIEPIGFGFMASLERYAEVHRRYPDAGQLMGIGNITELTSADTTGVNALLIAICEELGVRAVLTTEVIPWARGAVREIDIARRLMHHAVSHRTRAQGRRRPAGHRQGSRDPGVRRGRAAPAAPGGHRPQFPDLHRPGNHHRLQRLDLRPGRRHPGDLLPARRRRSRPTPSISAGS